MSAQRTSSSLAVRTVLAALAFLALISAALPFGALSAAHSCSMPCCASGTGCETGACNGHLFKTAKETSKESEGEKLCGAESGQASKKASEKARVARGKAAPSSDHCDHEEKAYPRAAPEAVGEASTPAAGFGARAFVAPCPSDCCAAANSSTQSRRWRDSVPAYAACDSLPSDYPSLAKYAQNLPPPTRDHLQRLRPRAPPSLTSSTA